MQNESLEQRLQRESREKIEATVWTEEWDGSQAEIEDLVFNFITHILKEVSAELEGMKKKEINTEDDARSFVQYGEVELTDCEYNQALTDAQKRLLGEDKK